MFNMAKTDPNGGVTLSYSLMGEINKILKYVDKHLRRDDEFDLSQNLEEGH